MAKMTEKTEPTVVNKDDNQVSIVAKIIALSLIIFILLVAIVLGLIMLVTRFSPKIDKSLSKPELSQEITSTNSSKFVLTGKAIKDGNVMIYVNGKPEISLEKVDKDGNFDYDYTFTGEGSYKFEASNVKGLIIRTQSELSDPLSVNYDITPPSEDIQLTYSNEIVNDNFSLSGKAEPNSKIVVKGSSKEIFETTSDDQGNFELNNIPVIAGENVFTIEISDEAGNLRIISEAVKVNKADINGNGVATANLPTAAGEFDKAMEILTFNNMLVGGSLIALLVFIVNMGVVSIKLKKE